MATINSADEATAWARRNLPAKNTLTAADAKIVEEWFQARLSTISDGQVPDGTTPAGTPDGLAPDRPPQAVPDEDLVSTGRADADTSQRASMRAQKRFRSGVAHALGKTVRLRDKDHRKFVLRQPCLVCGRLPSDPHHLTFAQPRAWLLKTVSRMRASDLVLDLIDRSRGTTRSPGPEGIVLNIFLVFGLLESGAPPEGLARL
jgi:hypothetical protein